MVPKAYICMFLRHIDNVLIKQLGTPLDKRLYCVVFLMKNLESSFIYSNNGAYGIVPLHAVQQYNLIGRT